MKRRSLSQWVAYLCTVAAAIALFALGHWICVPNADEKLPAEVWETYAAWLGPAEVESAWCLPDTQYFHVRMAGDAKDALARNLELTEEWNGPIPEYPAELQNLYLDGSWEGAAGRIHTGIHLLREGESLAGADKSAPERTYLQVDIVGRPAGDSIVRIQNHPGRESLATKELRPVYPELLVAPDREAALRATAKEAFAGTANGGGWRTTLLIILELAACLLLPPLIINSLQLMLFGIPETRLQRVCWYLAAPATTSVLCAIGIGGVCNPYFLAWVVISFVVYSIVSRLFLFILPR